MRFAETQDWRRRIVKKAGEWPTRLIGVILEGSPVLGDVDLSLSSPLAVICGPNGVGKSTLLRSIWAALDPTFHTRKIPRDGYVLQGKVTLTFEIDGTAGQREVALLPEPSDDEGLREVNFLDSSSELANYDQRLNSQPLEELLNGVASYTLNDVEIAEINFIAGREYRGIRLFEISDDDDPAWPFFEVERGEDRYDSRTMGTGELAIFHIWWVLRRCADNAILLLEEPETFLSYYSQGALMAHLFRQMFEKKLVCVIVTHSAPIVLSAPDDTVIHVTKASGSLDVIRRPPPAVFEKMGIFFHQEAVVFVEDTAAKAMLRLIIERYSPELNRRLGVEVRGGDGEVIAALKFTETLADGPVFLGAFDGDLRGNPPKFDKGTSFFLPGNVGIEEQFREIFQEDRDLIAERNGWDTLGVLLETLEGRDSHDWFEELSRGLGIDKGQLFFLTFQRWIEREENAAASEQSFNALLVLLRKHKLLV